MTDVHSTSSVPAQIFPTFQTFNQTRAPLQVRQQQNRIDVCHGQTSLLQLVLDPGHHCHLRLRTGNMPPQFIYPGLEPSVEPLLAALEAVAATHPNAQRIMLQAHEWPEVSNILLTRGIATQQAQQLLVDPAMLWQYTELWLPASTRYLYPQVHQRSESSGTHRWHPRRAPKPPANPDTYLYERFIPWLHQTIAFRVANLEQDLERLHIWMNTPHVAEFFQESGTLEYHRTYLTTRIHDPHMLPLIGEFNRVPFSYFEIYWAQENRLGPYYDAHDYDRGWHVLVGENTYRGRQYISAWLPSLMHYLFLDDPRTQRIVGEPQASHHQQIRNLEKSGFAKLKEFDFPHKRAALVMLLRERYFSERLWIPAV